MAQRTGADGLIAPRPRAAGAGVILALAAAAALALAGCGGGSSSDAQTASTPPAQASTGATSTAPPPSRSLKSTKPPGQSSSQNQGSAKHGPPIVMPKGAPEPAPTPAQRASATVADISLSSPALEAGTDSEALPTAYTCEGKGSFPALRWEGIPTDSAELALFVMNVQPVGGRLFFDWALAGLDPSLEGLKAGSLPGGAIVGRNSFGHNAYEICPPQGKAETYLFVLYALPKGLAPHRGFDPQALREEMLDLSGNAGLMAASYRRG